jgi:hypothetical protein
MRPKIRFDKTFFKTFFTLHGEKVLFGVAAILVAVFVWMGMRIPHYATTTPEKLLARNDQAEDYISDSDSWSKVDAYRVADTGAFEAIRQGSGAVASPVIGPFNPIMKALAKRQDPRLQPAEDVRVSFVQGQIAFKVQEDKPGKIKPRQIGNQGRLPLLKDADGNPVSIPFEMSREIWGTRPSSSSELWIHTRPVLTITSLAPLASQRQEHEQALKYAVGYDATRDQPVYVYAQIERRIKDGEAISEWKDITAELTEVWTDWYADPAPEVVPAQYVNNQLAMKIPPFLLVDYRLFASHPAIPLGADTQAQDKDEAADVPAEEQQIEDLFNVGTNPSPSATGANESTTSTGPPVQLVRFFDMSSDIGVGKAYQYRVRLWLRDPNSLAAVTASSGPRGKGDGVKMGSAGGSGSERISDTGEPVKGGAGTGGDTSATTSRIVPVLAEMLSPEVRSRIRAKEAASEIPKGKEDLLANALPAPWSEPSEWFTVPAAYGAFFAGPVASPPVRRSGPVASTGQPVEFLQDEPEVKLVAMSRDPELDVMVPVKAETRRGAVLNLSDVIQFFNPLDWKVYEIFDKVEADGSKVGRQYRTDAILVDIIGGHRVFTLKNQSVAMPGEILIMDASGNFIVRDELDDAQPYNHATIVSEQSSPPPRRKDDEKNDKGKGDLGAG